MTNSQLQKFLETVVFAWIVLMILGLMFCGQAHGQTAGAILPNVKPQFLDNNGLIASGGKLCTYDAGTSNPRATYVDSGLVTPNANPVVLDASGRPTSGAIYLSGVTYKFVLYTAGNDPLTCPGGGTLLWSQDNIGDIGQILRTNLAAGSGSGLVGFTQSGANATVSTLQTKLRQQPYIAAADFDGATADIKITRCLATIVATGGVCDARGLTGAQNWASTVTLGATKPTTLILGDAVYTFSGSGRMISVVNGSPVSIICQSAMLGEHYIDSSKGCLLVNNVTGTNSIEIVATANVVIDGLSFEGSGTGDHIKVDGGASNTDRIILKNNSMQGKDHGIHVVGTVFQLHADWNLISGTNAACMDVDTDAGVGDASIWVTHNWMRGCGSYNLYFHGANGVIGTTIDSNAFSDNTAATACVNLVNTSGGTFSNNDIEACTHAAAFGVVASVNAFDIFGNTFFDAGRANPSLRISSGGNVHIGVNRFGAGLNVNVNAIEADAGSHDLVVEPQVSSFATEFATGGATNVTSNDGSELIAPAFASASGFRLLDAAGAVKGSLIRSSFCEADGTVITSKTGTPTCFNTTGVAFPTGLPISALTGPLPVSGGLRVVPGLFAALPACAAGVKGMHFWISDGSSAVWGAVVTGGGANEVGVVCDGTDWTVYAK